MYYIKNTALTCTSTGTDVFKRQHSAAEPLIAGTTVL